MIKPIITHGLGALTPEAWSRIVNAVSFVENNKQRIASKIAEPLRSELDIDQKFILAKITAATELNGTGTACFQWKYSFVKVGLSGGASACTSTTTNVTPIASDAATWAINLCELGNTATSRSGYEHTSNHITNGDGFRIAKIPDNTIVQMFSTRHSVTSNRLQWFFNYQNPVVGSCPA